MKKLTMLQLIAAMALLNNSMNIYSKFAPDNDFLQDYMEAQKDEDLDDSVKLELSKTEEGQETLKKIIIDEAELEKNFSKIRKMVHHIHDEIIQKTHQQTVSEFEIARLAVELADAKKTLNETAALQEVKYNKKNQLEDTITTELNKAITALNELNQKTKRTITTTAESVAKQAKNAVKKLSPTKPVKRSKKMTANPAQQAIDYVHRELQEDYGAQVLDDMITNNAQGLEAISYMAD